MLTTRPATHDEKHAVRALWVQSYRRDPFSGTLPGDLAEAAYWESTGRLLARSRVLVAAIPDVTVFLGFLVWEPRESKPVVHYVFVKEDYRKHGVAEALFDAAGVKLDEPFVYTHRTEASEAYARRKRADGLYTAPDRRPGGERFRGRFNRGPATAKQHEERQGEARPG